MILTAAGTKPRGGDEDEDDAKQNKKANSPFKRSAYICRLKSDVKFQNFFFGHF